MDPSPPEPRQEHIKTQHVDCRCVELSTHEAEEHPKHHLTLMLANPPKEGHERRKLLDGLPEPKPADLRDPQGHGAWVRQAGCTLTSRYS